MNNLKHLFKIICEVKVKILVNIIISILILCLFSCEKENNKIPEAPKNLKYPTELIDQFSYALGHELGLKLRRDSVILSMDYYLAGLNAGMDSSYNFMTEDSMVIYRAKFAEKIIAKYDSMMAKEAEKRRLDDEAIKNQLEMVKKTAKEDGEKFLAENKKNPEVKVTKSGLQYKILKEGSGRLIKENDIVKIHMSMKSLNAPEFQNTRGLEPMIVPVKELFPGWKEGMQLMRKGSHYELYLPSELAFGEQGFGPAFPPNVVVIINVEVLDFNNQSELNEYREKMMKLQQERMEKERQRQEFMQKK
jgi:FKBP-type peptidyl-prolyl cis-trans isomerase